MEEKRCHEKLYQSLFGQALQKIKQRRDPHAKRLDHHALGRDAVEEQEMFDFGLKEMTSYEAVTRDAKAISIDCFKFLVTTLLEEYGYDAEVFVPDKQETKGSEIIFGASVPKDNTLLLFKEIEPDMFWKLKGREPEHVEEMLRERGLTTCRYIYLMFDKAYLQVVGHDDNEEDPGRGYNLFSAKWFFETYFGQAECECFMRYVGAYIRAVKDYLGYIQVKALTPNAMASFRLLVESHFLEFDYKESCEPVTNRFNKTFVLEDEGYQSIREQFIDQKCYLMMVGINDFAESFVTAEWLRDSMGKAGAIDLTAIGLGYFKAVEQLMYALICLHKNEGKTIKAAGSKDRIPLNDANIRANEIDTSLGSMAKFYKDYLRMFRGSVDYRAKCYIREVLFGYADLRNGYLHKDNIHDMARIDEIRASTIRVIFLLLGAHELDEVSQEQLGMPDLSIFDDYYRMCEYVNYHSAELYMVEIDGDNEFWGWSIPDPYSHVVDGRYVVYSSFYLKELTSGQIYQFRKDHMPKTIWLGSLGIAHTELLQAVPRKVVKLFDDGRFVGPSLADEGGLEY